MPHHKNSYQMPHALTKLLVPGRWSMQPQSLEGMGVTRRFPRQSNAFDWRKTVFVQEPRQRRYLLLLRALPWHLPQLFYIIALLYPCSSWLCSLTLLFFALLCPSTLPCASFVIPWGILSEGLGSLGLALRHQEQCRVEIPKCCNPWQTLAGCGPKVVQCPGRCEVPGLAPFLHAA